MQLAKMRAALSLIVDLKQAGELPAAIISTAMAVASPSRMRSRSPRTCAVAAFASAAVAAPHGAAGPKLSRHRAELFKGRLKVFHDLCGDLMRRRQVVAIPKALILQPKDVEVVLVSLDEVLVGEPPEVLCRPSLSF